MNRVAEAISGFHPSPWRDGLLLMGAMLGLAQAIGLSPQAFDAAFYWNPPLDHLYPAHWGLQGGYLYPPPLAVGLAPLHVFGWGAFEVVWSTLQFGALWVMARRWAWLVVGVGVVYLAVPIPFLEVPARALLGYAASGNVQLLVGAAIVLAIRRPGLWALPLLTKVGPGVGVLWHVFRREWRQVAVAATWTLGIAVASFIVAPSTWWQWLTFIQTNGATDTTLPLIAVAFPIRLVMSVALLAWGAPRGSAWVVPLAAGWAMPALYVDSEWAIWLGVIALIRQPLPETEPIWSRGRGAPVAPAQPAAR
jgi:Glycosyltransferase family 87